MLQQGHPEQAAQAAFEDLHKEGVFTASPVPLLHHSHSETLPDV